MLERHESDLRQSSNQLINQTRGTIQSLTGAAMYQPERQFMYAASWQQMAQSKQAGMGAELAKTQPHQQTSDRSQSYLLENLIGHEQQR